MKNEMKIKKKKRVFACFSAFALVFSMLFVFAGCEPFREKLDNMEFSLNAEHNAYTLVYYTDTATQNELIIPDEFNGKPITAIGELAIQVCDNIETIGIGKNIATIDKWGIVGNRHLKRINVTPENPYFASVDGILYSKDLKTLLTYPNANTAVYSVGGKLEKPSVFAVPAGVTTIAHAAFYECYAVQEIMLPSTITTIGVRAFHACTLLEKINLPEGLLTIGNDAFLQCEELTTITLPSTLQSIGDFALYRCSADLKVIILPSQAQLTQGNRWLPENNTGKAIEPQWVNG
jgi:hypothetical protein